MKAKTRYQHDDVNVITITIAGPVRCGKTTLAVALSEYLTEKGFDVVVDDDGANANDTTLELQRARMNSIVDDTLIEIKTALKTR